MKSGFLLNQGFIVKLEIMETTSYVLLKVKQQEGSKSHTKDLLSNAAQTHPQRVTADLWSF